MYINRGQKDKSFHKVVLDELAGRKDNDPQGKKYLELGLYFDSLSIYISHFGKGNVKIFFYEEMKSEKILLNELFFFLGGNENFNLFLLSNFNFKIFKNLSAND